MDAAAKQRIQQALWPQADAVQWSVWAVLDLARDRRIYGMLLESRLEFLCLYAGALPRELELAAPHIVELLPGHRLLDWLLEQGWGRSWGVFVRMADPTALRRHLRKFLRVRDEAGRRLLFRYYDPRVLRAFLPTCTASELKELLGPIEAWYCENADGSCLVRYAFDGRGLKTSEVAAVVARKVGS